MNAGVISEKEKVKESQSQSRSVTPSLDIHFRCRVGGVTDFVWKLFVLGLLRTSMDFGLLYGYWFVPNLGFS